MPIIATTYHQQTPAKVVDILEHVRAAGVRVRLWYGDVVSGRSWNDEWDVLGRISRSNGTVRIPIILDIDSSDGFGGPALLEHCIIRIDVRDRSGKVWRTEYAHTNFHTDIVPEIFKTDDLDLPYEARNHRGEAQARFGNQIRAALWVAFMNGTAHSRDYLTPKERAEIRAKARRSPDDDDDEESL